MPSIVSTALLQRIEWAKAQRVRPLWEGGPLPAEYIEGFIRKPGMGSYVLLNGSPMEIIDEVGRMLEELVWYTADVPDSVRKDGHSYWEAYLPQKGKFGTYTGYTAVKPLELFADVDLTGIRVRRGPHGIELVAEGDPILTRSLAAITNDDGLVTWYPGVFTEDVNLGKATVKLI